MAEPVGFEGANFIFYAPKGQEATVRDLEVFRNEHQIVSCWRLSPEELAIIQETGVVWLSVYSQGLPPVFVSGQALVTINGEPSKAEPLMPKVKRT